MASSEDFKRILELYNQESKTSGVSIVAFCQKNGIASRVAQILNKMKILKAIWALLNKQVKFLTTQYIGT